MLIGCLITLSVAGVWNLIKEMKFGEDVENPETVIMGWDYLSDRKFVSEKSSKAGYNTVAPIWYKIEGSRTDIDGVSLKISSDKEYVRIAHENGYRVWAMLSDGFSPARSRLIFENEEKMNSIIERIVDDVVSKDIDGINVDFEGDGRQNRDGFTRFVTLLSEKLKENGKIISVDVTGYDTYSLSYYYDRAALADVCDYIVLMGYDEHWSGSTVAGSVSSLGWVRGNVEKTLEEVPADKLVLGIPFYTRAWRVLEGEGVEVTNSFVNVRSEPSTEGDKLGTAKQGSFYKFMESVSVEMAGKTVLWHKINFNGKEAYVYADYVKVRDYGDEGRASSKAYAIRIQNSIIRDKNPKIELDEETGQNLAVHPNTDGSFTKIWLEDEDSIKGRIGLVKELGLAGVSAWRLGYEDKNTWRHVAEALSETDN